MELEAHELKANDNFLFSYYGVSWEKRRINELADILYICLVRSLKSIIDDPIY